MASSFPLRFRQYAAQQKLFQNGYRVLAAVSGGVDSMVLLHLLHQEGILAAVAHVNYSLRGAESSDDQQLVEAECARLGVPCFTKRMEEGWLHDHFENLGGQGDSLQMAARNIRYQWFQELLVNQRLDVVATAHHLDDQAEMVFMNTIKGMSFTGFLGIPVKNGSVIRPLLFATREQIRHFAETSGLKWREDSSNFSTDYQRNLIRHKVIPALKEINPSFPESMELGKVKNAGIYELFQIERDRLKKEMVRVNEDGQLTISKMELNKFRNPGAVLFHLIEDLGFSVNTCLQVSLEPGDQSGKHFLSKTHRLVVDRHEIILTLKSTRASSDFPLMITTPGFTQADGYSLHIEESLCRIPEFPNVNLAVLDADKLAFPLEWRRWESGDYFTPLGMSGRKKISDMLVDMKTPVPVKENVTVLLSGGKIAWVPGIRISNEFRLTDESVRAYRLEYGKLQV